MHLQYFTFCCCLVTYLQRNKLFSGLLPWKHGRRFHKMSSEWSFKNSFNRICGLLLRTICSYTKAAEQFKIRQMFNVQKDPNHWLLISILCPWKLSVNSTNHFHVHPAVFRTKVGQHTYKLRYQILQIKLMVFANVRCVAQKNSVMPNKCIVRASLIC